MKIEYVPMIVYKVGDAVEGAVPGPYDALGVNQQQVLPNKQSMVEKL